jgi:peptidoglycan/LPS O-acetylase OafA/YrhL
LGLLLKRPPLPGLQVEHLKHRLTSGSKLAGLQAARAFAALSVAYYHSRVAVRAFPEAHVHQLPGLTEWGFLGVNFFFAISGYVICLVTTRRDFAVLSFAIKRVCRLWPVYLLFVALAVHLHRTYGIRMADNYDRDMILYSATLLPLKEYPFYQVSWSLEHELVFYALAAVIVPFAGVWALAAVLAGLGAWAFIAPPSFWDWHIITTLQTDFLAGVLAYQLRPITSRLGSALPALLGATCLYALVGQSVPFTGSAAWFFALTALINARARWERWPLRCLVILGDASYSIFLSHWALIYVAAWWTTHSPLPSWMAEPWRFLVLFACCALSVVLWHVVEGPFISIGEWLANRWSPPSQTAETDTRLAADSTRNLR